MSAAARSSETAGRLRYPLTSTYAARYPCTTENVAGEKDLIIIQRFVGYETVLTAKKTL